MRDFRRSRRGLSEIVGTLFLVLIVVAAATAFSIFVATYQAQVEKEQNYTHNRNLELLSVLHVTPWANPSGPNSAYWQFLNFTVASLWIAQSVITGIDINDNPVASYSAYGLNLSTGEVQTFGVGLGGQFFVGPDEQFFVNVSATPGSSSSFYSPNAGVATTGYIKIDLLTAYDNDFNHAFIPPTAIPIVDPLQIYSGGTFITVPLLDGSQSVQPGNSTIIAWNWVVSGGSLATPISTTGEKVVPSLTASSPATSYTAILTVTNNDGLKGSASTNFAY